MVHHRAGRPRLRIRLASQRDAPFLDEADLPPLRQPRPGRPARVITAAEEAASNAAWTRASLHRRLRGALDWTEATGLGLYATLLLILLGQDRPNEAAPGLPLQDAHGVPIAAHGADRAVDLVGEGVPAGDTGDVAASATTAIADATAVAPPRAPHGGGFIPEGGTGPVAGHGGMAFGLVATAAALTLPGAAEAGPVPPLRAGIPKDGILDIAVSGAPQDAGGVAAAGVAATVARGEAAKLTALAAKVVPVQTETPPASDTAAPAAARAAGPADGSTATGGIALAVAATPAKAAVAAPSLDMGQDGGADLAANTGANISALAATAQPEGNTAGGSAPAQLALAGTGPATGARQQAAADAQVRDTTAAKPSVTEPSPAIPNAQAAQEGATAGAAGATHGATPGPVTTARHDASASAAASTIVAANGAHDTGTAATGAPTPAAASLPAEAGKGSALASAADTAPAATAAAASMASRGGHGPDAVAAAVSTTGAVTPATASLSAEAGTGKGSALASAADTAPAATPAAPSSASHGGHGPDAVAAAVSTTGVTAPATASLPGEAGKGSALASAADAAAATPAAPSSASHGGPGPDAVTAAASTTGAAAPSAASLPAEVGTGKGSALASAADTAPAATPAAPSSASHGGPGPDAVTAAASTTGAAAPSTASLPAEVGRGSPISVAAGDAEGGTTASPTVSPSGPVVHAVHGPNAAIATGGVVTPAAEGVAHGPSAASPGVIVAAVTPGLPLVGVKLEHGGAVPAVANDPAGAGKPSTLPPIPHDPGHHDTTAAEEASGVGPARAVTVTPVVLVGNQDTAAGQGAPLGAHPGTPPAAGATPAVAALPAADTATTQHGIDGAAAPTGAVPPGVVVAAAVAPSIAGVAPAAQAAMPGVSSPPVGLDAVAHAANPTGVAVPPVLAANTVATTEGAKAEGTKASGAEGAGMTASHGADPATSVAVPLVVVADLHDVVGAPPGAAPIAVTGEGGAGAHAADHAPAATGLHDKPPAPPVVAVVAAGEGGAGAHATDHAPAATGVHGVTPAPQDLAVVATGEGVSASQPADPVTGGVPPPVALAGLQGMPAAPHATEAAPAIAAPAAAVAVSQAAPIQAGLPGGHAAADPMATFLTALAEAPGHRDAAQVIDGLDAAAVSDPLASTLQDYVVAHPGIDLHHMSAQAWVEALPGVDTAMLGLLHPALYDALFA